MKTADMKRLLDKAGNDIDSAGDIYRRDPSDGRILEILSDLRTVLAALVERTAP